MHVRLVFALLLTLGLTDASALAREQPFQPDENTVLLLHLDGDGHAANVGGRRFEPSEKIDYADGRFGKALALSGEGVLWAYRAAELMPRDRSWTVECWIKPAGNPGGRRVVLGGWGNHGRQYRLALDGSRLTGRFAADDQRAAQVASGDVSGELWDGDWHRVALVLDRARNGEVRLYLDGKQVNDEPAYLPWPITIDDGFSVTLGATVRWGFKWDGFQGLIDEVRISDAVRPAYAAAPDAPKPPPVPERPIHPGALIRPDAPESGRLMPLGPENTVLVLPDLLPMTGDHDAANLLQTWLRKARGVDAGFQKVSAPDATTLDGKLILALGRTRWVTDEELDGLDAHGFLIRRKGSVVVLAGGSPRATLWAAVHFLDRFVGVRFYMPGDLFTSVPHEPPGPIGAIDLREEPYVRSCTITGMHNDYHRETPWMARVAADRRRGGSHQHNMFARFDPARYAEEYPEIYPIIKGRRFPPKRGDRFWQPCFSEPKLIDAAVDSAIRYFQQNPDADYVGFSVEDGKQFCECDRCLADLNKERERLIQEGHDPEEAAETALNVIHSTLYWTFLNRVAARLEEGLPRHGIDRTKLIVGLVYSRARHNPGFKLHPNVLAWFVFKWSDGLIDQRLIPQPDGSYQLGRIDDWLSVASHIGHHDWAHGKGMLIPRICTGLVSESFKLLKAHDLTYLHTEGYPNWGLDGPKLYVHSRIWWDPDADVTAIWRGFCDDMFGPAAGPMYDYFSALEELWISLNDDTERKLNRWWSQFDTTPEQRVTIARCRALLDKAAALAKTLGQRQRIELFSRTFRLSEYLFALAAKEKVARAEVDEVLQYAETVIKPDPMTIYRNDREGNYAYEQIEKAVWTLASRRGLKKPE